LKIIDIPILVKQRHSALTIGLFFLIIANLFLAYICFSANDIIKIYLPNDAYFPIEKLLGIIRIINVLFLVLLFIGKRNGFYGLLIVSAFSLKINIAIGFGMGKSLIEILVVLTLCMLLLLKKNSVTTWDNLK
jgi:hypothetical protein